MTLAFAFFKGACGEARDRSVHSADVILNILACRREVIQPLTIAPAGKSRWAAEDLQRAHEPWRPAFLASLPLQSQARSVENAPAPVRPENALAFFCKSVFLRMPREGF